MSISCFYQKTLLEAFSRVSRKLAIPTKMRMAKNKKTLKFIQRLSRLSREKQLPTKQLICFSGIFESNFARSLPTKSACFQFLKANSDSFSKVLDSKTLRTNVLKLQFVLYQQTMIKTQSLGLGLFKVCLFVKLELSDCRIYQTKSARLDQSKIRLDRLNHVQIYFSAEFQFSPNST